MSLSIATFADLGKKNNLKTAGILPVIKKFEEENELKTVICRINRGFYFKNTISTITIFYHNLLKIIELFILRNPLIVRKLEENLLDRRVSNIISRGDTVLFYPEYFFKKSLEKSNNEDILTIGIASMANSKLNAKIEDEEFSIFKIPTNKQQYRYYNKLATDINNKYNFSYIIAFSDFVKNSYIQYGFSRDRIFIAQSDVNPIFFNAKRNIENKIFRVIYVADTNPLKGLHYLLDAWKDLHLENAELVIIGGFINLPKEFSSYYERIIKSNPSIKSFGHISQNELIKYYENASVFVLPSLTEGNPRVVMEAMAVGLPVITTENARSLVVDGESGFIVPIRDSKAIYDKIRFLYSNLDKARLMGEKGRNVVKNKEPFSEQVFNIYKEILKRGEND